MTPFVEGYTEALRKSLHPEHQDALLADETLARIIADCKRWRSSDRGVYSNNWTNSGLALWAMRQSKFGVPGFPPLTVRLGDDGKVYLS